jgi:geranylgeranyl diphosphate synthase type II
MHGPEFFRQHIEAELAKMSFGGEPEELYAPIRYTVSLGGKRLRPALLLMAHELFGGDFRQAMPQALAIELFHNFTLLHDDIMDRAPLRRGQPSVHSRWNANIAILAGDTLFVKSCEQMMQGAGRHLHGVMELFFRAATEVCEGQQADMNFETAPVVTVDAYLSMIGAKTAALLACACAIGARTAGAAAQDEQAVAAFARHLGIAFQLHDDILDVYGDAKKFGKLPGGDILANKKTFLLLSALQRAEGPVQEELQRWLSATLPDPAAKVAAVRAIYSLLGIREAAEAEMETHFRAAQEALDAVDVPGERKTVLKEFAGRLKVREA